MKLSDDRNNRVPSQTEALSEGFNYVLNFGKHKGRKLGNILDEDPSYIIWLSDNDILKINSDLLIMACQYTMPPDPEYL